LRPSQRAQAHRQPGERSPPDPGDQRAADGLRRTTTERTVSTPGRPAQAPNTARGY